MNMIVLFLVSVRSVLSTNDKLIPCLLSMLPYRIVAALK